MIQVKLTPTSLGVDFSALCLRPDAYTHKSVNDVLRGLRALIATNTWLTGALIALLVTSSPCTNASGAKETKKM